MTDPDKVNIKKKATTSTHLVEIFNQIFNASQDTFGETKQNSIVLGPRGIGQSSQSLNNGDQQRSKTDTSKTGGQRPLETIKDGSRAKAVGFVGSNPPSGHNSSNGDVNGVLLTAEEEEEEEVGNVLRKSRGR